MADGLSLSVLTPGLTRGLQQPVLPAATSGKSADGAQRAKIEHSAEEFESILLSQWLEQAREAFASVPGGSDDGDDPGASQIMGLGMQALASAVTKSGGIGIARLISRYLERETSNVPSVKEK